MKLNKGQINRQSSKETDQARALKLEEFPGHSLSGFCESCSKWSVLLKKAAHKKICKQCMKRIAELGN